MTELTNNQKIENLLAANAQLDAAFKRIHDDFEKVVANRQSILVEKRALEGKPDKKPPAISQADVTLTQTEARNAVLYQAKKALANKHGLSLQIVRDTAEDEDTRNVVERFEDADNVYVSHEAVTEGGHRRYKRERKAADEAEKNLIVVYGNNFPDAAFDAPEGDDQ